MAKIVLSNQFNLVLALSAQSCGGAHPEDQHLQSQVSKGMDLGRVTEAVGVQQRGLVAR